MEHPIDYLRKLVLLFQFVAHVWILVGHKQVLGSASSDRSADPLFSKSKMILSLTVLLGLHFLFFIKLSLQGQPGWVAIVLNFPILANLELFSFQYAAWADLVGLLFFSAGFFLRLWSMRILGKFFTFEIGIREKHQIIKDGPYRYLRHPSYTGYALMLLGAGISLHSGLFILLTLPGVLIFFLLRIHAEEKMLQTHFGEEYLLYQKSSKKLIPWVY